MKALQAPIISSVAIGVMVVLALPASAESTTKVVASSMATPTQYTVNFADLDVTSPEGQKALLYRISYAAKKACGSSNWRRAGSLALASRNRDCYEESISRALSEVQQAAVAAAN